MTDQADPIARFIEDMRYHGKSDRTRDAYERVIRQFEAFLCEDHSNGSLSERRLADAGRRDCMAWVHSLRQNDDLSSSTIATYASYLNRFYRYMNQTGEFDSNPMVIVMEELEESIQSDPNRRDISIPAMRDFVEGINHPLDHAVVLTLLKTGIRVGELCNLDLRDIHIDDQGVNESYSIGYRSHLETRPDSLFVASDIARRQSVNGERRTASNKRTRDTVIPIDHELKFSLTRWLAIRPVARSSADPVFVGMTGGGGHRLTPDMVRSIVKSYTEPHGWYESGAGPESNVTPHYFRHFFTTHLRDRTGDRGVVKYLRGDVADDIIDTYTHNWGDQVRTAYETHIYRLLDLVDG